MTTPLITADIARLVTERETRLADLMARYDLRSVRQAPFLTATARDIAAALDKLERMCAA